MYDALVADEAKSLQTDASTLIAKEITNKMKDYTDDERVDFNLRFHWIPTVGDDLYVVWNSGYTTDPTLPHRFPSSYTLKRPLNGAIVIKATHRLAL